MPTSEINSSQKSKEKKVPVSGIIALSIDSTTFPSLKPVNLKYSTNAPQNRFSEKKLSQIGQSESEDGSSDNSEDIGSSDNNEDIDGSDIDSDEIFAADSKSITIKPKQSRKYDTNEHCDSDSSDNNEDIDSDTMIIKAKNIVVRNKTYTKWPSREDSVFESKFEPDVETSKMKKL